MNRKRWQICIGIIIKDIADTEDDYHIMWCESAYNQRAY